jgi:hypothetical protein
MNDVTKKDCFALPWIDDTGHAGSSQMVLHSVPKERLLASVSPGDRQREVCILEELRAIAVHSYALWPLHYSSDILELNGDSLKMPHDAFLM